MSRRVAIFETIGNFFDFERNRTGKSILLFLAGFAALGTLTNALFSLASFLDKWLLYHLGWGVLEKPGPGFMASLADVIITFTIVGMVFVVMWRFRSRPAEATVTLEPPKPHEGLIFLLSSYSDRGKSGFARCEDIDLERSDARLELFKSNWGPLAIAVEHHAARLRHCWLLCTGGKGGSADQFEQAKKVVQQFSNLRVHCHKESTDSNDVSKIANDVRKVYQKARYECNLIPEQIIADFTGGTAAMSGGLVLASVSADYKVEYVRQDKDKPLFDGNRALTKGEVLDREILITVVTSPSAVEVPD